MCGILGASFSKGSINREAFQDALEMLSHRGPDSTGVWFNDSENDALGFKRLSIIDLTKNGDQPLESMCGNYKIIFNGEIYNFKSLREILLNKGYTFNSSSDTEVLLKSYMEWGVKCLHKIDGMFAFAIYDSLSKSIFAARDLAGQKPLYYSIYKGSIIFASEIKPITFFDLDRKIIGQNSIKNFFRQGFISRNQSIYKNIHKLPPSHYMIFDLFSRDIKISAYDDLISKSSRIKSSSLISDPKKAVSTLDKLLDSSVESSLISDVPLGVLLSGGLDSSLIAAYASRHTKNLKTFSVIFPNHNQHNEQTHARKVADFLKTDHFEINAEEIRPELIEDLAYYFDEPFADPSMIPTYLLSKYVKKYCSVAIGGDGGDELFGGYPSYSNKINLMRRMRRIPLPIRRSLSRIIQKFIPSNLRGFSTIKTFGEDFNKIFTSFDPLFYSEDIKKLMNEEMLLTDEFNEPEHSLIPIRDFLTRISIGDYLSFLSEDVLVKVDRASMAHSLEVRSPLLSRDIIDFAFLKLHPDLKVNNGEKKIILKLLGKSLLPENFVYNRKQGFSFPLRELMYQEDWKEFYRKKIENFNSDILSKDFAIKLLNDHSKIKFNDRKLFAIIQFICWHEKHTITSSH
jgi:asparagine synthase (glutamine-hydrolysing)